MAQEHSPRDVAAILDMSPVTLRKWSQEFASLLSSGAAATGHNVRRRYSDTDIAILRQIQTRLHQGATYQQIRVQFNLQEPLEEYIKPDSQSEPSDIPGERYSAPAGMVTILDERPEVEGLRSIITAQTTALVALQGTVEAQSQLIAQLQHEREQDRANVEHLAQVNADQDHTLAELRWALEQANNQAAEGLEAMQGTLERIPRWLRALLGIASVM